MDITQAIKAVQQLAGPIAELVKLISELFAGDDKDAQEVVKSIETALDNVYDLLRAAVASHDINEMTQLTAAALTIVGNLTAALSARS